MERSWTLKVGLIWILFIASVFSCFSQVTAESEYQRIRELAIKGDHSNAAKEARLLLNKYPEYGDVRILLSRINAWQGNFVLARTILDTLLLKDPGNNDALELKKDIERWAAETPADSTWIITGYSLDNFSEPYSRTWHMFTIGSGHKFKWGLGSARLNTGYIKTDMISATEFQLDLDAYPKLSEKNYGYLAYAFSPGKYFPSHRAALELWQVLPDGWAISAGLNYYYFDRNIFIAVTSLEKYLGNYWLSGRTLIYFKDNGPTLSFFLFARKYFNDFDYLQLSGGTGTAPDEPFDIRTDIMRLSANSLRLAYFNKLSNTYSIRIGVGYSIEEYQEAHRRNRYEANITLNYHFRSK